MSTITPSRPQLEIENRFRSTRRRSLALCEPLSPEDMMVQSSPEASPAKWHLAHTAWFFESFILREFLPGYQLFNADFPWLFNSYYQSFAAFPEKRLRASFSRPGLDEVLDYREHVDLEIERLVAGNPEPEALKRIELGAHHEEQHQELLLTDILNAFFTNPLRPAYMGKTTETENGDLQSSQSRKQARERHAGNGHGGAPDFVSFEGGLREAGYEGEGFCFDNELPRHKVWLEPYSLARRLVTCEEFAAFIADGGYRRPELWLSAGWDAVRSNGWQAPLYWTEADGGWKIFTLRGEIPLDRVQVSPVSHVSFYEADAYARWTGKRLPTEFEWENAAEGQPVTGNLLDSERLRPLPATEIIQNQCPTQLFGDCWEWTASAYLGYPGFQPLTGSLGEYNGKFMSGQMVLRGGSCVTPADHIRSSYRNFFPPETRWQFSGIRLAS
ncbi:MAG: ergothioneine biosynthesis protein EgtB [Terracidiphilus sp.]|jgi:ergothioneine biosynthesis protein EgtB